MNKSLLLTGIVILFLFTGKSFGQTANTTTNLKITLSDVLSMTVNLVDLNADFNTETKYTNGIDTTIADNISVVSSRNYKVTAKIGTLAGTSGITVSNAGLKITQHVGATNLGDYTGVSGGTALLAVAGTEYPIITSTKSSWSGTNSTCKFDIQYKFGTGGAFAVLAKAADNVIPVIYTITQP